MKYTKHFVIFGSLLLVGILFVWKTVPVLATHHYSTLPDDVEQRFMNACPGPGQPGQSVHGVYPSPSQFQSSSRDVTTTLYSTSYLCPDAPYNSFTNSNEVTDIVPTNTSATFSIGPLPYNFPTVSVSSKGTFAQPVGVGASISNLQDGWNCWNVYFTAHASNGSGSGYWSVCVYFTFAGAQPPTGSATGDCSQISGTAQDPNYLTVKVELYVNGVFAKRTTTSGPLSGNTFSFNITSYQNALINNFQLYAIGVDGNNQPDGQNPMIANLNIGPCNVTPPPACSPSSQSVGIGQNASLTASSGDGSYSWSAPGGTPDNDTGAHFSTNYASAGTKTITVNSNGLHASCTVVVAGVPAACNPSSQTVDINEQANFTASGGNGSFTWSAPNGSPASAPSGSSFVTQYGATGTYTVTVTSNGQNGTCNVSVVNKPYLKVYGGDVSAGAGFGNSCSQNSSANVIGWNKDASPWNGASAQFATRALANIASFASSSPSSPPLALSFANTVNTSPPNNGGQFGGVPCAHDFYGDLPATATTLGSSFTLPATAGNLVYKRSGTLNLNGGTINPNQQITIYVTGDVRIDTNIVYNQNGWNISNPANPQVPSFRLVISGGNLYINRAVTQLDGLYVAQPSGGTGGLIYTCAQGSGFAPVVLDSTFYSKCAAAQLVINGAFVAKQVNFMRAIGTLSQSNTDAGDGLGSNHTGEYFNFTPALWLQALTTSTNQTDDAITSLPPVL